MAKNLQAYKLGVNIEANGAKALGVLRDVDRQAGKTAGTLAAVARVGKDVGAGLSIGLTAPLTGLGVASVRAATQMDSLTRGLQAVSGSSEEANRQLARLKEVAKLPGLGFAEAVQGSINLQAAGISANLAERSLKAFGNALATVGKGKSELDGVILALGQIESKGKVSAEEINQLAERVPQIRKAIVAAFGTADTEVLQKAKITSRQFTEAVVRELERLPQATAGAQTTFENLSDSYQQSLAKIGNAGLRILVPALEKAMPLIEDLGNRFAALNPETQKAAIYLGGAAAALGPLAYGTSTAITGLTNLASGVRAVTTSISASGGLLAALGSINPVMLAVSGAVIAGGVVWYEYSRRTREAADAIEQAMQRSQRARAQMGNTVTLADGKSVNVLTDRETSVDLSNLPKVNVKTADTGFVALNPDGSRPDEKKTKIDLAGKGAGKGTGKGKGDAAKEAAREQRELQEVELQIARDGIESRLRIEQDGLERRARTLQDAYGAGLLTTREYYQRTAQVAHAGVDAELKALQAKRSSLGLEQARTKPGSADALRIQGQLYQLDTEQYLKLSEGIRLAADNVREFKRELGGLGEVDLSQQAQVIDLVPEIIRRARERNAELSAKAGQGDLVDAEFERDRERIQLRVVEGTLSEAAAKREVTRLELGYRDKLIEVLEAKKEAAGLDAAAIAALDAQIARAKQLGQATRKPTESPGFFSGITRGARNEDGDLIANATAAQSAMSGLASTLKDVGKIGKDAFGSMANGVGQVVSNFVLLGETGPGALKKITAQILASAAAEAAVKSLMSLADGFAHLFTNPAQSAADFTAAGIYAAVAVGTGLAGRALSGGKKDKGQISDEQRRQAAIANVSSESYAGNRFERRENGGNVRAGAAYLIGERRPEVVEFPLNGRVYASTDDYARKRQQADQLRSAAAGYSTETFIGRALQRSLDKLEAQLARLEPTSGDDYFLRVMDRNPRAVGRAAVSALDQDDQLSSRLGRRIAA